MWVKAWQAGEGERRQRKGVHLLEGMVLEGVVENVEELPVGDHGLRRSGCWKAVAGAVLNFRVGAHVGAA